MPAEEKTFEEACQGNFYVRYPYSEVIFQAETRYQRVALIRTLAFGRALFLDEILNSAESDEFIYHEGIVHPAMIRAASRASVLIIGGAEGGTLREVLKYRELERAVVVDIDEELVSLCREHLSDIYGNPWSDPRAELIFGDGREYLQRDDRYDVIIIDLNEAAADSPAQLLFTREFYEIARRSLRPGGMISIQSEWLHSRYHVNLTATHRAVFPGVRTLDVAIPSFLQAEAFNLCTEEPERLDLEPEFIDLAIKRQDMQLKFYNGAVDRKISTLPPFIIDAALNPDKIFTDCDLPVCFHG